MRKESGRLARTAAALASRSGIFAANWRHDLPPFCIAGGLSIPVRSPCGSVECSVVSAGSASAPRLRAECFAKTRGNLSEINPAAWIFQSFDTGSMQRCNFQRFRKRNGRNTDSEKIPMIRMPFINIAVNTTVPFYRQHLFSIPFDFSQ